MNVCKSSGSLLSRSSQPRLACIRDVDLHLQKYFPLASALPNLMASSLPVIRHVASSAKSALGLIYVQCHVKPGASKQREGIISVSDSVIEVCVSAQPRDGEANKAVRELFSDVG